jgi:hypothetical protein
MNRYCCCYYLGPKEVELDLQISAIIIATLQQKVSLYLKWFHWILNEFIGLVNKD